MSNEKWNSFTINLGKHTVAQERRGAYEAAAFASGSKPLSKWAKEILDKAASFNETEEAPHEAPLP